MKLKYWIFIATSIILLWTACDANFLRGKTDRLPVARAGNNYFYLDELIQMLPRGLNAADSLRFTKGLIDQWVRKQLVLQKAEINLSEAQKDVQKQLEDYRSSLLIYKYHSHYVMEKLDTAITQQDIETYYNSNIDDFNLNELAVRALFLRIPIDAPDQEQIGSMMRNWRQADSLALMRIGYQYGSRFDHFDHNWVYFSYIAGEWPLQIERPNFTLQYQKYFRAQDSVYNYYLKIHEIRQKGEKSPMNFERNKIKNILLNKRKLEMIGELENSIYQDALNKDEIQIYTPN